MKDLRINVGYLKRPKMLLSAETAVVTSVEAVLILPMASAAVALVAAVAAFAAVVAATAAAALVMLLRLRPEIVMRLSRTLVELFLFTRLLEPETSPRMKSVTSADWAS